MAQFSCQTILLFSQRIYQKRITRGGAESAEKLIESQKKR